MEEVTEGLVKNPMWMLWIWGGTFGGGVLFWAQGLGNIGKGVGLSV